MSKKRKMTNWMEQIGPNGNKLLEKDKFVEEALKYFSVLYKINHKNSFRE